MKFKSTVLLTVLDVIGKIIFVLSIVMALYNLVSMADNPEKISPWMSLVYIISGSFVLIIFESLAKTLEYLETIMKAKNISFGVIDVPDTDKDKIEKLQTNNSDDKTLKQ